MPIPRSGQGKFSWCLRFYKIHLFHQKQILFFWEWNKNDGLQISKLKIRLMLLNKFSLNIQINLYLSIYLSIYLFIYIYIYLSIYLSIYLTCICLSLCLSIYLSMLKKCWLWKMDSSLMFRKTENKTMANNEENWRVYSLFIIRRIYFSC